MPRTLWLGYDHWLATDGNPAEDEREECVDCDGEMVDGFCEDCGTAAPEPDWEAVWNDRQESAR